MITQAAVCSTVKGHATVADMLKVGAGIISAPIGQAGLGLTILPIATLIQTQPNLPSKPISEGAKYPVIAITALQACICKMLFAVRAETFKLKSDSEASEPCYLLDGG